MNTLIIFGAKYLIYILILIAAIYFLTQNREKQRKILMFAMITLPVSYIIAKIASFLYYDPRPFVAGNFSPLIPHDADNGFPSDHTLLSSAIAAFIFPFSRKMGIFIFILALLVGFSRVLAGVHHILDIVGSLTITIIVSFLVYQFFPKIAKK